MKGVAGAVEVNEFVKPLEDLVDRCILTSAIPPTLNHSLVVSIDDEMPSQGASVDKVADQTLEANSFGPANVLMVMQSFPSQDELPGSPVAMDNDADANTRAHIRICVDIE